MSDELKLCPFCGNVPELGEHNVDQSSWKPRYDVACRNDKCILQRTYETQAVAVAAWNTRPIEDELRAENAALKDELKRVAVFLAVHGVEGYTIVSEEPQND